MLVAICSCQTIVTNYTVMLETFLVTREPDYDTMSAPCRSRT